MFGLIGKVLTFIPGLTQLGNTFIQKHYDAKVQIFQSKTGASKEVAQAAIAAQAQVATRWWFVAAMIPAFALPFAVWTWKAVAIDKVFCPIWFGYTCQTDSLGGDLSVAYNIVVGSLFGFAMVREFTK